VKTTKVLVFQIAQLIGTLAISNVAYNQELASMEAQNAKHKAARIAQKSILNASPSEKNKIYQIQSALESSPVFNGKLEFNDTAAAFVNSSDRKIQLTPKFYEQTASHQTFLLYHEAAHRSGVLDECEADRMARITMKAANLPEVLSGYDEQCGVLAHHSIRVENIDHPIEESNPTQSDAAETNPQVIWVTE